VPTILFLVFCWLFIKAIKAVFKPRKRKPSRAARVIAAPEPETDDTEPDIYDQKRALLEYLMYLDDMIAMEDNPEKTMRYLDKKTKVLKDLAKLNKRGI